MLRSTLSTLLASAAFSAGQHVGPVTDIAVGGERVFSASQAGLMEGVGNHLRLLREPTFRITALATHPRGDQLLVAGGEPGRSGAFERWRPDQPDPGPTHRIGNDLLYGIALHPTNGLVAFAAADGTVAVRLSRADSAEWTTAHPHTAPARAVRYSPDGRWLASAGLDGVVMISSAESTAPAEPRSLLDHTAGIDCLVFSPDSRFLASGSRDSKVRLHQVDGTLVRTYDGLGMEDEPVAARVPARILALAWSGSHLVAGTSKGSLHLLSLDDDTVTALEPAAGEPVHSIAFASEGNLVVGSISRLETRALPRGIPPK